MGGVKAANAPPFRLRPGHERLPVPTPSLQPSFQPGAREAALPHPLQNALSSKGHHKPAPPALPGSPHLDVASAASALRGGWAPAVMAAPSRPKGMLSLGSAEGWPQRFLKDSGASCPLHFIRGWCLNPLDASGQPTPRVVPSLSLCWAEGNPYEAAKGT